MIHAARQLGCFDVQGVTGEADHTEEPGQSFGGALLGPVERGTLGIGVDQQDAAPLPRPLSGKVQRERGLADTALLIEERDDHERRSNRVREPSERPSLSEELIDLSPAPRVSTDRTSVVAGKGMLVSGGSGGLWIH